MGTQKKGVLMPQHLPPYNESFQVSGENMPTQYLLHHEKVCHITY